MLSMQMIFWIGVGALIFFYSRITKKKMASGGTQQFMHYVDAIVSKTLAGSTGYQADLGYLREDGLNSMLNAALEYNVTHSSTGAYKYYKYYIAALGAKDIVFIPCKYSTNLFKGLQPQVDEERMIERYPLEQVKISKVKDAKNGLGGMNSIEIEFVLPDKKQSKKIDFFIRPEIWQRFAVT